MRRAAKIDVNQPEIVDYLRASGWSVLLTHAIGKGAPDAFAARNGFTAALEIKDGRKPPSKQKLTLDEQAFSHGWRGVYLIVTSPSDALKKLQLARAKDR